MKYAGRVLYDPYFEISQEAAEALTGKAEIADEVGDVEEWETIADFMEEGIEKVVTYLQLHGTDGDLKVFLKFNPETLDQVNLFIPEDQDEYPGFQEFQEAFFSEEHSLHELNETAETFLHGQSAAADQPN